MSGEDVTDLRVWLDEQIGEALKNLKEIETEADLIDIVDPRDVDEAEITYARLRALREARDRLTPDTSAYAAKAGPAAARGYADGWLARRAHEEGPTTTRRPHDIASGLGVTVDGTETPRELAYALLVDRGHAHPSEVLAVLDDLGLDVTVNGSAR